DLIFEVDILSEIDWTKIDISEIAEKTLTNKKNKELELILGLSKVEKELLAETGERVESKGTLEIDEAFLARQISEIVPNPWICYNLGKQAIELVSKKHDKETIASNFVFIIEELKKILENQKNIFAESVFKTLVTKKKLHFFLISNKGGFVLPSRIKVKSNKQLIRNDNTLIQKSLFDYVPEENINELEKSVAIYLDEQEKLLWWYRNMSRQDYHIQGWKKNKIYPDFVAANKSKAKQEDYDTVFVLETKGIHLQNEDTKYKQDVFALCNELGAKKAWKELFDEFPDHDFEFQVVFEDEWENKINGFFN
ncbi:MAG: restriction endonuclease subunit R, partial [Cytophagales bacterium]